MTDEGRMRPATRFCVTREIALHPPKCVLMVYFSLKKKAEFLVESTHENCTLNDECNFVFHTNIYE
jgi:hypothetical protein